MTKHTPAPWTLSNDGFAVCYFNPQIEAGEDIDDPAHDSVVAQTDGMGAFSGIDDEVRQANARLICEAPALLALAQSVVATLDEGSALACAARDILARLGAIPAPVKP